jgi:hypothetical protein
MEPFTTDTLAARGQKVRLELDADGRAGLFQLLQQAAGAVVGDRFVVEGLWATGRQVHVFAARDRASRAPVILKQPAFDYRNPLQYGRREAARLRETLAREHEVLGAARAGYLSTPVALIEGPAIVPEGRDSRVLGVGEVFAVEEWLDAIPLAEAALGAWPSLPAAARDAAAARIAAEFVAFWDDLAQGGWLYVDVNAFNLMVARTGGLRVVDAGSAVRAAPEVVLPGVSPAFTTPALWEGVNAGRPFPGALATVLPLLGKVLHFALTRREPHNGVMPDLDDPALGACSRACREALGAMVGTDGHPRGEAAARAAISRWYRQAT